MALGRSSITFVILREGIVQKSPFNRSRDVDDDDDGLDFSV